MPKISSVPTSAAWMPSRAVKALDSARRAFAWVEKNPNILFTNPIGIGMGACGDRNCTDEILWAAAEPPHKRLHLGIEQQGRDQLERAARVPARRPAAEEVDALSARSGS